MTGRVLAGIALRVWGVVFVIGALTQLPQWVGILTLPGSSSNDPTIRAELVVVLLNIAVRAIVGALLIAFADRTARAVVPETPALAIDADPAQLTTLAFGVAGVVILVWGLMEAGVVVYAALTKPGWPNEGLPHYAWGMERETIVRATVEVAAGAVLVLGRKGIAEAWWRMRGRTPEDAGDLE